MFSLYSTTNTKPEWEIEGIPTPKSRKHYKKLAGEILKHRRDLMNSDGWTIYKDAEDIDDVIIETKELIDSPIIAVRATGFCRLRDNEDLHTLTMNIFDPTIKDRNVLTEHIVDYDKLETISRDIELVRMKAQCPGVSNRDFLILRTYEKTENGYLIGSQSINHVDHPFDPNCVRGVAKSGVEITPVTDTVIQIISIDHIDPKGWIPAGLINMLIGSSGSWIQNL